jgi:hypothetical protein
MPRSADPKVLLAVTWIFIVSALLLFANADSGRTQQKRNNSDSSSQAGRYV